MMAAVALRKQSKARPEGRALLAFSLIEVITVLVVIVVIAAIAVPRYAQADARYRLEGAGRRIQSDIELMRSACRADGQTRTAVFTAASGKYQITSATSGLLAGQEKYVVLLGDPPYRASMSFVPALPTVSVEVNGRGECVGTCTIVLAVGRDLITVAIGPAVTVSDISVGEAPMSVEASLDIPVEAPVETK